MLAREPITGTLKLDSKREGSGFANRRLFWCVVTKTLDCWFLTVHNVNSSASSYAISLDAWKHGKPNQKTS